MNNPSSSKLEDRKKQQAINLRLQTEARRRKVSIEIIRTQTVFECFLRRVFSVDNPGWMLKGGASLLMRNGTGRFTRDLDLSRAEEWSNSQTVAEEFREIAQRQSDDPFTFRVEKVDTIHPTDPTGYSGPSVRIHISANIGLRQFHKFTIDVTVRRLTQFPAARVPVVPIINLITGNENSECFYVYATAIEGHLADKICAMYESYPSGPSTRYRDLTDIITILQTQSFSAEKLTNALYHESHRRHLSLPHELKSPGLEWEKGFSDHAKKDGSLTKNLQNLSNALSYAGNCINPILADIPLANGYWDYRQHQWIQR